MNVNTLVLRANALYLIIASTLGFGMDMAAIYFGRGPASSVLAAAPYAGIGLVEAHGLAFILGVVLWRMPVTRAAHLLAASVVALLGTCNVVFWELFDFSGQQRIGYVATSGHWLFASLQLMAASSRGPLAAPERFGSSAKRTPA